MAHNRRFGANFCGSPVLFPSRVKRSRKARVNNWFQTTPAKKPPNATASVVRFGMAPNGEAERPRGGVREAPSSCRSLRRRSLAPPVHNERRDNDDEDSDKSSRTHVLLQNTRGAQPPARHGPLQRLLERTYRS